MSGTALNARSMTEAATFGGMPLKENLLNAVIAGKDVLAVCAVAKAEGVRPNFLMKQIALHWSSVKR